VCTHTRTYVQEKGYSLRRAAISFPWEENPHKSSSAALLAEAASVSGRGTGVWVNSLPG